VADEVRAHLVEQPFPGHRAGAVFVIGGEDFVAFFEIEGADDKVDAPGRVHDLDNRFGSAIQIGTDGVAGFGQESIDPAAEQLDRLPFQLALPVLVGSKTGMGQRRTIRD